MATPPNKKIMTQLFGRDVYDCIRRSLNGPWSLSSSDPLKEVLKYTKNVKAVKTKHIGDDFVSDLSQSYKLDDALKVELEEGEWWRPYIFDGQRWTVHHVPAPWWGENPPLDRRNRILAEFAELMSSDNIHKNHYARRAVLLWRELMDCAPDCEVEVIQLRLGKALLDQVIMSIGDNPPENTWYMVLLTIGATRLSMSMLSSEHLRSLLIKGMPHALTMAEDSYKLSPRDKKVIALWRISPDLKKEEIMDTLVEEGFYKELSDAQYLMVGTNQTTNMNNFGNYLSRLRGKIERHGLI